MAETLMPKTKLPLNQAEEKDLLYWAQRKEKEVAENTSKYPDADSRDAKAMRAELDRRAKGGKPAAAPAAKPSTALAPTGGSQIVQRPAQSIVGSYADARKADDALRAMSEAYHLVSPATSCGSLPLGHEVNISLVYVDVAKETNSVGGGKVSLAATALKRIASAASIDWDDEKSRRLDNGRDPHYVHFRAVGIVKNLDGTKRRVTGEVEIDMRDGSPQVLAMRDRASTEDGFRAQLRDTRLFILRHAETKAKSRAIADMGVRRSYTVAELEKPFAVARLAFTGRTENPRLEEIFAGKIADSALGAADGLYGRPVGLRPQPPAPDSEPAPQAGAQTQQSDGTSQQGTLPGTSSSSPY
jgi:hypothetical protein